MEKSEPLQDDPRNSRGVFLSYGRKDTEPLAQRIASDLTDRGFSVWVDQSQIQAGHAWQEQIEKAILARSDVVALLSPHAVRRPDGICLDEISFARFHDRRIVPVMAIDCQPPLCIYRLDWVDLTGWQNPGAYERSLERLITALNLDDQSVEGEHARIFGTLRPLDFGADLVRLTRDFTGRTWLFDRLDRWLEDDDGAVFFITGDPGTGKSAVMARLAERHPSVVAYHFCISRLPETRDASIMIRSIAAQLATQLPAFRSALAAIDLEAVTASDAHTQMRRLIADPASSEHPDQPLLILVDALDEAAGVEPEVATVLRDGLQDLPPWLRFVISSRRDPEIIEAFSAFRPHEIDTTRQETEDDLREYLNHQLTKPPMQAVLSSSGVGPDVVAGSIMDAAQGNFLYASHAVEAIETGQLDPRRPDAFPAGLAGTYQRFFDRVFTGARSYAEIRPLLEVIGAAREPLSAEEISQCTHRSPFAVAAALEPTLAFFPVRNGRYRPHHTSMLEWMTGGAGEGGRYRVDLDEGRQLLLNALWEDHRAGRYDGYAVRHLAHHLHDAGRDLDLAELLTTPAYEQAKKRVGLIDDLVAECETALGHSGLSRRARRSLGRHQRSWSAEAAMQASNRRPDRFRVGIVQNPENDALARALYEDQRTNATWRHLFDGQPVDAPWDAISDDHRERVRSAAQGVQDLYASLGAMVGTRGDGSGVLTGTPATPDLSTRQAADLAALEHQRFMTAMTADGWRWGPSFSQERRERPDLVVWDHLPARDRQALADSVSRLPTLLDGVGLYVARSVHEAVAKAAYADFVEDFVEQRRHLGDADAGLVAWDELSADLREGWHLQASASERSLSHIGCRVASIIERVPRVATMSRHDVGTAEEVEQLARADHEHWVEQRRAAGWTFGPMRDEDSKQHPYVVPWDDLPDELRDVSRYYVERLPTLVQGAGFCITRSGDRD